MKFVRAAIKSLQSLKELFRGEWWGLGVVVLVGVFLYAGWLIFAIVFEQGWMKLVPGMALLVSLVLIVGPLLTEIVRKKFLDDKKGEITFTPYDQKKVKVFEPYKSQDSLD